jgi:uncharacterized protein (TIGR02646 family)
MRRLVRVALDANAVGFLRRRQQRVDDGDLPESAWKTARQTKTLNRVFDTLVAMARSRARCYFCSDSRGTDIEHFWPKAAYANRTFIWENMLLACAGCNRAKGNRFPLDGSGIPLLIDPTSEDPWDFLYFDESTGQLVARLDPVSMNPNQKGETTCYAGILPLNLESITEGRQRVFRRLRQSVSRYLGVFNIPGQRNAALAALRQDIVDNDEYGLADWFFRKDGQQIEPFSSLRTGDGAAWAVIQGAL